ncbi:hypothetical protein [Isoptericola sediminis]|uniref:Uncharacterized protein n=1 Tax=Isoptericola sediminis TaxID=2733572 RepID=A0A849K1R9_9MICO|nr:hypothetical protein [Isoptericola sediminis]NNU26661.1 hypothetical protein [Isoptericola sediminis]
MSTAPDSRSDHPLDPAASLDLIAESQRRVRRGTEPDCRLICLVWGIAWAVGYLVLWTSARALGVPGVVAYVVFGTLLAVAVVVTIVHSARRAAGTRGPGHRATVLWGATWFLAFGVYPFVIAGLGRAGASDDVTGLASNALACVIIGVMYLTGGASFGDRGLFVLGAWILLTGGVATMAGMPATYLVMATVGGGGFLAITVVWQVLHLRRRAGARR